MKIITSTVVRPVPTDCLIKELFDDYRVAIPTDYVKFIKKYNGVVVEDAEFLLNGREYMIERFLNILEDPNSSDDGWYTIDVVESQIFDRLNPDPNSMGSDLIPIAAIFAGDMVCLDYRNDAIEPALCVWSHEESGDFEPVTYRIANSFSDFLKIV